MTFELAGQNEDPDFQKILDAFLEHIGFPEALVTEESIMWDFGFLPEDWTHLESRLTPLEIRPSDKLFRIAKEWSEISSI